jgi:hypothetical protein
MLVVAEQIHAGGNIMKNGLMGLAAGALLMVAQVAQADDAGNYCESIGSAPLHCAKGDVIAVDRNTMPLVCDFEDSIVFDKPAEGVEVFLCRYIGLPRMVIDNPNVQQQAAPQVEAPRNRGWKDVDPYAPYTKMMGPFGF